MNVQHDQDTEILETCIDLLQAAWQIEDAELERLLEVRPLDDSLESVFRELLR